MTLNAGVTPVTNLTTIRARRLVTVAGDAVCYVVVRESRRVGSSGTRVLSSIGLALRCYWHAAAKGCGLKCPGWWECSLAAISQTTAHMHWHHEATMGLAGVSLGRELRALALSHTASVRRGTA